MKVAFLIVTQSMALFVLFALPFVLAMRGSSLRSTVLVSWSASSAFMLVLCFGIPALVSVVSPQLSRDMFDAWVPEGTAVAAILCIGWFWPYLVGVAVEFTRRRQLPRQ